MRTSCCLLATLLAISGCGSEDNNAGSSTGMGGASSGGSAGTSGGPSSGGGGSAGAATLGDHEAACRAFCATYTARCGVDCPETCDGYANTHGLECAALGVSFFECLSNQPPSSLDCEAGIMVVISDACVTEEADLSVCRSLDAVACERRPDSDDDCSSTPATPFAFRCVSSVAPPACVKGAEPRYCCPTE
jgi:hypothetical protein